METTPLLSHYTYGDEFKARLPSPPRLSIPTIPLETNKHNSDSRRGTTLSPVQTANNIFSTPQPQEWTYDLRRQAQQILPNLFLGPTSAARDRSFLLTNGITLLVGFKQLSSLITPPSIHLTGPRPASLPPAIASSCADLDIDSIYCGIVSNDELPRTLRHVVPAMVSHLSQTGTNARGRERKVLLHCESGNERSATACAAYLISAIEGVNYVRAIQSVQHARFCANFEDGLKRCLLGWNDMVKAGRDVEAANMEMAGYAVANGKGKRGRDGGDDENGDSDMDMDSRGFGGGDAERFDGRSFTPFIDI